MVLERSFSLHKQKNSNSYICETNEKKCAIASPGDPFLSHAATSIFRGVIATRKITDARSIYEWRGARAERGEWGRSRILRAYAWPIRSVTWASQLFGVALARPRARAPSCLRAFAHRPPNHRSDCQMIGSETNRVWKPKVCEAHLTVYFRLIIFARYDRLILLILNWREKIESVFYLERKLLCDENNDILAQ